MKKLRIILAVISVLLLFGSCHLRQAGVPFSSEECHFSINFPAKPKVAWDTVKTMGPPVITYSAVYGFEKKYVYSVFYNQADKFNPHGKTIEEMFENARVREQAFSYAIIMNVISTRLTGDPFTEFTLEGDDYKAKERIYIINNNEYDVRVMYNKAIDIPADADEFLTSFRYIK